MKEFLFIDEPLGGGPVTAPDVKAMMLNYVQRLKNAGADLNTELLAVSCDMSSIAAILATNPEKVYAFFGIKKVGGVDKSTVILVPVKDNRFVLVDNKIVAFQHWDPALTIMVPMVGTPTTINIPTPQSVDNNDTEIDNLFS